MVAAWLAAPVLAQKAVQTGTQFYMAYRAAFDKAKKIEELLPYMSKETTAQINETPAAERPQMFEMVKMMGALTGVKVIKETPSANGATLSVEGTDPEKKTSTGTIELVKENGAWKISKESWSTKG
jgi:hypothetical protein